jgi:hypothetical protein
MPRHEVTLTLVVTFDGDYYGSDELVTVCKDWIESAFYDRDDLRGCRLVTGTVAEVAPVPDGD